MEPNVQTPEPQKSTSSMAIAIAIVVAALMISGTLIAKSFIDSSKRVAEANPADALEVQKVALAPITNKDHILGNPKAQIILVEYSDTECPYCKQFHITMQQIIKELGADGKVAWVYRHFPLYKGTETQPALHPKAGKESEATECAAELGGSEKFWAYLDEIYRITPSNNGLDGSKLYDIAADVGLNKKAFQTCLDSDKYTKLISDDYNAAITAGARGTPYTIILDTRSGETIPLDAGAIPYPTLKAIVQAVLAKQ